MWPPPTGGHLTVTSVSTSPGVWEDSTPQCTCPEQLLQNSQKDAASLRGPRTPGLSLFSGAQCPAICSPLPKSISKRLFDMGSKTRAYPSVRSRGAGAGSVGGIGKQLWGCRWITGPSWLQFQAMVQSSKPDGSLTATQPVSFGPEGVWCGRADAWKLTSFLPQVGQPVWPLSCLKTIR